MKRALLVEIGSDGSYRIPWDTKEMPFEQLRRESDSVEKVEDLTGREPWTELYNVEVDGAVVLYFVREDPEESAPKDT